MKSAQLVIRSVALLSGWDRAKLAMAALLQACIAILDLFAVLVLGLVAATATAETTGSSESRTFLAGAVDISAIPILTLAIAGAFALIAKSLLSLTLTRRIYRFLANRQALVAGRLAERLLTGSILDLQARPSQQTAYALTTGVNAATVNTLGPATVVSAEASLVILLMAGLLFVDPLVAIFSLVFFGLLGVILQLALGRWAQHLGDRQRESGISSMETLQHSMRGYREIKVSGRRALFISRFTNARWEAARVQADLFILSQLGKYVFEIGLVVGGGLLIIVLAQSRSITASVAILTVFLIASSRLVPSLLRMQAAFSSIRNSAGLSEQLFSFVDHMSLASPDAAAERELELRADTLNRMMLDEYPGFAPIVQIADLTILYPGADRPTLQGVTLSASPGSSIALVGPTGAGKSTLADAILGVLEPTRGSVSIAGIPAGEATSRWPGAMAYVPQDVAILTGSIRDNVALGIPKGAINDDWVWHALDRAKLSDFVNEQEQGLDTLVGEHGVKLSGGQRQRLGLARALYSRPKLIVLDEATSALDAETEYQVGLALQNIGNEVTTVIVAHRLATIREVDQIAYLDGGVVAAVGTFDQVRQQVPHFERQASLLGL